MIQYFWILLILFLVACGSKNEPPKTSNEVPKIEMDENEDVAWVGDIDENEIRLPEHDIDQEIELSIEDLVRIEARRQGIEEDLAVAIAMAESNLKPRAELYEDHLGVSSLGVFQVLETTAEWFCGIKNRENLIDPERNISCGLSYFRHQLDRYGDEDLAILAYNAGSVRLCKNDRQVLRFKCIRGDYLNKRYLERVRIIYDLSIRKQDF